MAGEGDAGMQGEDENSSAGTESEQGAGKGGTQGEANSSGSQGSQAGGSAASAGAGSRAGQAGDRSGAGGTGTTSTAGGSRSGNSSTAGKDGGAGGGGSRTDSERVAELDRELDGQMGAFDGMLLEEREQILAAQETGDDAGGDEDGAGGSGASGEESGAGAEGEGDDGTGSEANGEAGGTGNEEGRDAPPLLTKGGSGGGGGLPNARGGGDRKGDYEQVAIGGPVPQDIPNSDGDDVVARQLREAAMRETDPVLREKLWNEYRKYKGLPVKETK